MTVKSQLSEKEFIQVSLLLMYSKSATRTISIVAFVFLMVAVSGFIANAHKANPLSLLVPLAMLTALPLSIYFSARKAYRNIHQLREVVIYSIDKNGLVVKGETYSVTYQWSEIYKVSQTKNWILIWQDKQRALPIAAKDVWGGQVAELKDILDDNGVKNDLTFLPK